jgi:hypothetical protein
VRLADIGRLNLSVNSSSFDAVSDMLVTVKPSVPYNGLSIGTKPTTALQSAPPRLNGAASSQYDYAMRNHDKAILYKPQSTALNSLREVFLYRHSLVKQRVALSVRRDEKRLTQEKSDAKTFMSLTSKHLVTEVNKAIAKCDQKIREIIASDDELCEVFEIVTSMPGIGPQNASCLMVYTDNFTRERGKHPLLAQNNGTKGTVPNVSLF